MQVPGFRLCSLIYLNRECRSLPGQTHQCAAQSVRAQPHIPLAPSTFCVFSGAKTAPKARPFLGLGLGTGLAPPECSVKIGTLYQSSARPTAKPRGGPWPLRGGIRLGWGGDGLWVGMTLVGLCSGCPLSVSRRREGSRPHRRQTQCEFSQGCGKNSILLVSRALGRHRS